MKITERKLRQIVRQELIREDESKGGDESAPSTGEEIKGGSSAQTAKKKLESNPAIKDALDKVTTATDLAATIQSMIDLASEKGIDEKELKAALSKVTTVVKKGAGEDKKNENRKYKK